MGISVTQIGTNNEVSGTCTTECDAASVVLSNLVWTSDDSVNAYVEPVVVDELIDDGPAVSLNELGCGDKCTECRKYHWLLTPNTVFNQCADETVYVYNNRC